MPALTRPSSTCCRMGRFATGIITFGRELVKGRKRVPSPAASTTAFKSMASGQRFLFFVIKRWCLNLGIPAAQLIFMLKGIILANQPQRF